MVGTSRSATERTFEALVFDWDGTAVADRSADATELRRRLAALSGAGVHLVVVTGTHVENVDRQLQLRPPGPGRLLLCVNRGSEVFEATPGELELRWRRQATAEEDEALDRAAAATVAALADRGLSTAVVGSRLNRRKVDLIPEAMWADPPKARIGALLRAVDARLEGAGIVDLAAVVAIAMGAARGAGLAQPRITSDVKHVEIGLTDKSDSARWVAGWLAERGITGGLIAVVGDEFGPLGGLPGSDSLVLVPELARAVALSVGVEPSGAPAGVTHFGGGPATFLDLLDDQRSRRREHRVPDIDDDPAWVVPIDARHLGERVAESLGALSNGAVGLRGAREEDGPAAGPMFLVAGAYDADANGGWLVPGPVWTRLRVRDPGDDQRRVDLRTGLLVRDAGSFRSARFLALDRPHLMGLRAEGPVGRLQRRGTFDPADATVESEHHQHGPVHLARTSTARAAIAVACRDRDTTHQRKRSIERLAAWATDDGPGERLPSTEEAERHLAEAASIGFDRLLADHRAAWARRWRSARVDIEGSPDDELAARFAVFHLLGAVAPGAEEAAVGARGLTGPAYRGHVFWDADVHVLPALAALDPPAARAMLEYRLRRLAAARAMAAALGRRGARFPWESAGEGGDVTPTSLPGPAGTRLPVRTGEQEEHIVADVAWAAVEYATWAGDDAFLAGPGADLLVESARYWASRVRTDPDGQAHIDGVMGPDEYHHTVDDNAFTNVLVRWTLRRAADHAGAASVGRQEIEEWSRISDSLVDGWDPGTGAHEQFAGYWDLEPLLARHAGEPPVAADLVLGAERVAASQIIKQADVLLLHHLVPDELRSGSLARDIDVYEPRTAHGSSLSPAIHAAVLARAGRPDRALDLFRLASRVDLHDTTGTTGGGLHLAAMGGLWQALAGGFLGLRPRSDHLEVDPCLPADWRALALRFRFHGVALEVRATRDEVRIRCDDDVLIRVVPGPLRACAPPGATVALR